MYFSRTASNISDVIPAMDILDEQLTTNSRDKQYLPCIRAALNQGRKVINLYYSRTDHSELYRIAMGVYSLLLDASIILY